MFNSRGFKDAAAKKGAELEASLLKASENGKWPIVCDTSPCLSQIKSSLSDPALRWAGGYWQLWGGVLTGPRACGWQSVPMCQLPTCCTLRASMPRSDSTPRELVRHLLLDKQLTGPVLPPYRRFSLYEPVEFVRHFLLDKLEFSKVRDSVAVHIPCSSKKMGIEESFMKVGAALCPAALCCA
jgi:hypothetical protein